MTCPSKQSQVHEIFNFTMVHQVQYFVEKWFESHLTVKRNLCCVESHEKMIDHYRNIVCSKQNHQHNLKYEKKLCISLQSFIKCLQIMFFVSPDIFLGFQVCPAPSLELEEVEEAQTPEMESWDSCWDWLRTAGARWWSKSQVKSRFIFSSFCFWLLAPLLWEIGKSDF